MRPTPYLRAPKGRSADIVLLNAAGALVVVGEAGDLEEGLSLAAESLDERPSPVLASSVWSSCPTKKLPVGCDGLQHSQPHLLTVFVVWRRFGP